MIRWEVIMNYKYISVAAAISLSLGLSGCDHDDDDKKPATVSLGVSDASVDEITALNICFSAIEFKALGDGESKTFTVGDDAEILPANSVCPDATNTVGINLLDYIGEDAEQLINNAEMEAGEYKLRVIMSEGSFAIDKASGEEVMVEVPSNELKLVNALTFAQGGVASYTLEFDLRKSMVDATGQEGYKLKPTGVRLVNNTEVGTLTGNVSSTYLMNNGCEDVSTAEGDGVASIYMFESPATMPLNVDEVYATGTAISNGAGGSSYEIGYVLAGQYDVAISCNEFKLVDGVAIGGEPIFIETIEDVEISAEETQAVNF